MPRAFLVHITERVVTVPLGMRLSVVRRHRFISVLLLKHWMPHHLQFDLKNMLRGFTTVRPIDPTSLRDR